MAVFSGLMYYPHLRFTLCNFFKRNFRFDNDGKEVKKKEFFFQVILRLLYATDVE